MAVAPRTSDKSIGVRRLGFGVSGPHGTLFMPRQKSIAMIRRAFHHGVRLFDTGPAYGAGEAERRLGAALQGLPRWECIISTKVGINSSGLLRRTRDFSPDGVRRSIDGSLKRLRVQRLNWLFLHGPAPQELTDSLLKTLVELKFMGVVDAIGVAGRGREIDAALSTGVFSMFMAPVHAGLKPYDIDRLNKLKSTGAELIGIETLTPASRRYPAPTGIGQAWRLVRALAGRSQSPSELQRISPRDALIWALSQGGAHRVVTTTTRMDHLDQNVAAAASAPNPRLIAAPSSTS